MHAEATSEKMALARFLDGSVSLVFGSHTHVQTSDEQIFAGGTAYITDVGMTGPSDGVIGMTREHGHRSLHGDAFRAFQRGEAGAQAILRGGRRDRPRDGARGRDQADLPAGCGMIGPQKAPATNILKVSAQSNPNSVAGALAGVLRERAGVELQAIGAGATNQAVKAIAIARSYLETSGIDLVCIPEFTDVTIEGKERTAMRLIVERRPRAVVAANAN